MRALLVTLLAVLSFPVFLQGQSGLITNLANRQTTSLNGTWHYIIDPYETGYYDYRYIPYDADEDRKNRPAAFFNHARAKDKSDLLEYSFDDSPTLLVPSDWNSQDDKLLYYEGTIWYKKSFDYKKSKGDNRVYVHFGAVNYIAEVYLNGEKLGIHEGGFTPFQFEVTDLIRENDNFLVVKADNSRFPEAVPTVNTDWWNYGGITRDVALVEVPPVFVRDYLIQLEKGSPDVIAGFIALEGASGGEEIDIKIPELDLSQKVIAGPDGKATFRLTVPDIRYWSPTSPTLYKVTLTMHGHVLNDQIGFRTIESRDGEILLNGERIFLRGICMHEENTMRGSRAHSKADALIALEWAKELNCNFMRLAHYPHNEKIVRMADREGMLLWEEIPVYWTIDFTNKGTYEKAVQQLEEVITRDKNRASVIIWSVANETPVGDARNTFMKNLIEEARRLDETRLVSAALQHRLDADGAHVIADPVSYEVDVLGFNQYLGWYGGKPKDIPDAKWSFDQNKPVIISEFGAGALAGFHGDRDTRWTEEYQEYLYQQTIKMMEKIPELRGVTPWILADFRSPKRTLPKIQDGWNRKGLIANTGARKKAFYVMQKWYAGLRENPPFESSQ